MTDTSVSSTPGTEQKKTDSGSSQIPPPTEAPDKKATEQPPKKDVTESIHSAFMLGWQIFELRSRIGISAIEATANSDNSMATSVNSGQAQTDTAAQMESAALQQSMMQMNDSLRLASRWRAMFGRIVALHCKVFPTSNAVKTLYIPPDAKALPYLYPPKAPDYADIGIRDVDNEGAKILEKFQLFDVTRRAINCLTLLHVNIEESLIPEDIQRDQTRLTRDVLTAPAAQNIEPATPTDPNAPSPTNATGDTTVPVLEFVTEDEIQKWASQIGSAIEKLSALIVKFLDAWDGYVRENFYAGQMEEDENILVAYEAGRSMASLSWSVSVKLTPLELKKDATTEEYNLAWATFNDRAVIHVQHQISALSATLDDAYYLRTGQTRPAADAILVAPNPEVPSQVINAVKHSLDYWVRAVKWVTSSDTPLNWSAWEQSDKCLTEDPRRQSSAESAGPSAATTSKQMRIALTEQADIWQILLTGQQSLRGFNAESVTQKIVQDVTGEIGEMIQKDLSEGGKQSLATVKQISSNVSDFAKSSLDGLVRNFWPIAALIGLIAIVVGVGTTYFMMKSPGGATVPSLGLSGVITSLITAVAGALGIKTVNNQKEDHKAAITTQQNTATAAASAGTAAAAASVPDDSLAGHISGLVSDARTALIQAFENGYKQIRIELDILNQSIGVASPLVEFFVMSGAVQNVNSDYTFLTEIIWSGTDRQEEFKDVARAAFGPISALLGVVKSDLTGQSIGKPQLASGVRPAGLVIAPVVSSSAAAANPKST